ncbi:MAG: recombinase RecA [Robiginitomaculum sp.]|nr:MAG: recombinase RecA [Robiginitomaculum sp.]
MSALRDKLVAASTLKYTSPLEKSEVFGPKVMVSTAVPMINVALSGRVDGGISPGLLTLAGPSKHFKSVFGLIMAAAWMKKHKDCELLFFDSEFGSPLSYFESLGIDTTRVTHIPITNVEELKVEVSNMLSVIGKKDKVFILIDSIGNLASKKEVDDAMDGKSVADMTRAKQLKSVFRIITPHLTLKKIPMVVINHTYMTQEMFSKAVVSGGTGVYYSSDDVWIIGRQQDKAKASDKTISGYNFIINIDKSRSVVEKSKIPITVSFEGGVAKFSGLFELAKEAGILTSAKVGWYQYVDSDGVVDESKSYRARDFDKDEVFWTKVFKETKFADWIKNKYTLSTGSLIEDDE